MNDLEKAKKILSDEGYTCVFCKDKELITSTERGVAPLLKLLDENRDLSGFSAADKVVGNGAAFLYILLNIKELHAFVISTPALKTLTENNIKITFDTQTEAIRNRTNTGFCPIESLVRGLTDPQQALSAIKAKLQTSQAADKPSCRQAKLQTSQAADKRRCSASEGAGRPQSPAIP